MYGVAGVQCIAFFAANLEVVVACGDVVGKQAVYAAPRAADVTGQLVGLAGSFQKDTLLLVVRVDFQELPPDVDDVARLERRVRLHAGIGDKIDSWLADVLQPLRLVAEAVLHLLEEAWFYLEVQRNLVVPLRCPPVFGPVRGEPLALLFRAAGRTHAEGSEETLDGESFLQCPQDLPFVLGDDRQNIRFGYGRVCICHFVDKLVMGNPARVVGFRYPPAVIAEFEEENYPEEERIPIEVLEDNYKKYYLSKLSEIKSYLG